MGTRWVHAVRDRGPTDGTETAVGTGHVVRCRPGRWDRTTTQSGRPSGPAARAPRVSAKPIARRRRIRRWRRTRLLRRRPACGVAPGQKVDSSLRLRAPRGVSCGGTVAACHDRGASREPRSLTLISCGWRGSRDTAAPTASSSSSSPKQSPPGRTGRSPVGGSHYGGLATVASWSSHA